MLILKVLFSHFIPKGAPVFMLLMLFIIELISLLIQPITLSIRLIANIFTGHVLLSLTLERFVFFCLGVPLSLAGLELIVRGVQAVVYILLLLFYTA